MIEVELPSGEIIEVDTDDEQQAVLAARRYLGLSEEPQQEVQSTEPIYDADEVPSAAPTEEEWEAMQREEYIPPEEPSRGVADYVLGAPEAALTTLTGVPYMASAMIGTAEGMLQAALKGKFGTPEGDKIIKDFADRYSRGMVYTPETQTARDILGAVGEVGEAFEGIAPISVPLTAAGQMARPAVTQAARAGAARMLPARPKAVKAPKVPSETVRAVAEAEARDIPVMTTDVVSPDTFTSKWIRGIGEKIPVTGTGGKRAKQKIKRVEAVKETLKEYGLDDVGIDDIAQRSDDVTDALLGKRKTELKKYSDIKSDAIRAADNESTMPVRRANAAIDDEIARLEGFKLDAHNPIIDQLKSWKRSMEDQPIGNIEEIRKDIGKVFDDPNLKAIKDTGNKALRKIYDPLRKDMGEFIENTADKKAVTKWKLANARLANLSDVAEKSVLKDLIKKGDSTPETIRNVLFSKKASDVKTLYNNLDMAGKAKAKIALFDEALSKSFDRAGELNADKFTNEVGKLGKQFGIFLNNKEKMQLDGLKRALRLTKRAEEYTPTGIQTLPFIGGAALADIFGSAGGAIVGGGSIGGLARLYESTPVRNAFIKLGRTQKNSKAEKAAMTALVGLLGQSQKEDKQ